MLGAGWVFSGVAAVFAVGDWIAVARRSKPLEYVCKPATLAALIAVALALEPAHRTQRAWFVAALALCLAGDVFLMLPRDLFLAGLGAFLLGHLAYVVGLNVDGGSAAALVAAGVFVAALAVVIGGRILRSADRAMRAAVGAYIAVISAMVASALATGDWRAATGAGLFYVSDALIAWNRFVRALAWVPLAIIVTYHVGQAFLVGSLVS